MSQHPVSAPPPATLGELRASGYRPRSVKQELRDNLVSRLATGRPLFPGVVGYEDTVIPAIENAVLAGQDIVFLGERGQAKTRLARSLVALLDDHIPAVEGSELHEDPFAPLLDATRARIEAEGDGLPIAWLDRSRRYGEKLATPDITIADLIGEVDPIKVAEGRYLADASTIHYGLIPRTNRGIFTINELPDLQARIQVGLLNILEEGDIQIRGFPLRLPLDLCLVFSANPEDYTHRGSIITPLRDRISSQIHTHYPRTIEDALAITTQEAWADRDGSVEVAVPRWVRLVVEEVAFQARASELVDPASGVSARLTIALLENTISNAERRALANGESRAVARAADVLAAGSAVTGKIELVYEGEREGAQSVSKALIGKAIKAVFDRSLPDAYAADDGPGQAEFKPVLEWFGGGRALDLSDELGDAQLEERLAAIPALAELAGRHLEARAGDELAAAMEFVLEGLHQSSLLAKDELSGGRTYRDMFEEMVKDLKVPKKK